MTSTDVATLPTAKALGIEDLAKSGLTEKDAKKLSITFLSRDETEKLTDGKYRVAGAKLPYFNAAGTVQTFFRLKFLEVPRLFGKQAKAPRYWQAPGSPPRVYLPPLVDWAAVVKDTKRPIWLTEGEKKAAAACKAGIPCIGLGGVWSWKSTKQVQPLLPDLEAVQWDGRPVTLCFDADADPKPEVQAALEALALTLEQRGATVDMLPLPLLEGTRKTGLDDYLVACGKDALLKLEVGPIATTAKLLRLNEELAIIESMGVVAHLPSGKLYANTMPLSTIIYADRRVTKIDSQGRVMETSAINEWLKWPKRRRHTTIVYEPGRPGVENNALNLWHGSGVIPKKGNVAPFLKLVNHHFQNESDELKNWLLSWLAYPLQYPGTKMYAAVVLFSPDTGTGKTLLGQTMGMLYGHNFGVVTEAQLHSGFNDWLCHKEFILGEEVTGSDRRAEADRLKHLVTGETVDINQKYQVPYKVRNCANFLFTTNHPDAFLLDDHDRRYFVHRVPAGLPEQWFFNTYDPWYRSAEGQAALLYHLLSLDLTGFEPKKRPPITKAHQEMVSLSGGEGDYLARWLKEAPDAVLRMGDTPLERDLYTLTELLAVFDPDNKQRLTRSTMSRALKRAGFLQLEPTKTSTGTHRLWAARNPDKWAKASHAQRVAGYETAAMPPAY